MTGGVHPLTQIPTDHRQVLIVAFGVYYRLEALSSRSPVCLFVLSVANNPSKIAARAHFGTNFKDVNNYEIMA